MHFPSPHPLVLDRRRFLAAAGVSWLTPLAGLLAREAEQTTQLAQSLILIWLDGGPSQLETFDPHPGTKIGGSTTAIATKAKGVQIASGFEQLADQMDSVSLIRSMVSKEGDHERGTYLMKTGYRPDPTVEHPSIGAICCHELPGAGTEIPRHISILAGHWPGRGGFLGGEFDAFQIDDPKGELPDVSNPVKQTRDLARASDLEVLERAFARGRSNRARATLHRETISRARVMMSSEQLRAFDVSREPKAVLAAYGDTPFGRGCLAARRLVEVGARCVEVSLGSWDSHVNNHEVHRGHLKALDPALAALIRDLKERKRLDRTIVICCGEFGRSPKINLAGGRDHWTGGYSMALAGGGIKGGLVLGETDPEGTKDPTRPTSIEDAHATILSALGLDPAKENIAPATGRPIKLSQGKAIRELLV